MVFGYVYCLSNPFMPGMLKVGMTMRFPQDRARELFTTGVPTPFKVEIAKKVLNPKQKEKTLHILLSQYTDRLSPNREFFRVSVEEVKVFFDLMDGEVWVENPEEDEDEDDYEEEEEEEHKEHALDEYEQDEPTSEDAPTVVRTGCRDMTKCFTNGQQIRHTIGVNKTWVGTYDSVQKGIVYDGQLYKSISKFVTTHYSRVNISENKKSANGWLRCECEVNGQWISTYNL